MTSHLEPADEAGFAADYADRTLASVRLGLVLGGALYGLFAVLDIWMLPESWRGAHWIRFGLVIPVCLAAVASTFMAIGKRHLQTIASAFVIVAGLGIVWMIVLAEESEPGFRYYYAGLLLVLTYSFAVVRLRFVPTAVCSVTIIVGYVIVAIVDQRLLVDGVVRGSGPVFLNNNYFLVAAGIITLMGSYLLEEYARNDFLRRNELSSALDELKATQTQLIQSERTAAMASVVAGLLHELNNPVGAIASAADVVDRGARKLEGLRGEPSAAEAKTMDLIGSNADVIRTATARVTHALEVLKRFTHLDKAATAEYHVNDALEDCLSLLAHETGERIVVKKSYGELPAIHCRPGEVNQLFMSLLKNAVEAIPGSGAIELTSSAADGSVRVDIADTGVGIAKDRLAALFSPQFSRGGSRVKLGLGLMTAQSVVQQHGGTLAIESSLGAGTRVSVTLPVNRREAP